MGRLPSALPKAGYYHPPRCWYSLLLDLLLRVSRLRYRDCSRNLEGTRRCEVMLNYWPGQSSTSSGTGFPRKHDRASSGSTTRSIGRDVNFAWAFAGVVRPTGCGISSCFWIVVILTYSFKFNSSACGMGAVFCWSGDVPLGRFLPHDVNTVQINNGFAERINISPSATSALKLCSS